MDILRAGKGASRVAYKSVVNRIQGHTQGGGATGLQYPPSPKSKFKKHRLCRHDDIRALHDLPFSRNQPLILEF